MTRRRTLDRVSSKLRALTPLVDRLEAREMLAGQVFAPMFQATPFGSPTPPASAFTPSQIKTAYGFSNISFGGIKGDGTGTTIAIVDAYDDPTAQADLNTFSTQFGLPATTLIRVGQNGGAVPGTDSTGGWEEEESLDVQWAHAIAPGATILLVEANSASDTDLLAAVDYAAAHAQIVSMSWGGGEFSGETSYDTHFKHAGTVFVASSGDNGAPISWPASSANVLAVGGTALKVGSGSVYASESGWSGSGGGPSAYVSQPSYQTGVVTQTTTKRANPDVAYDASPSTGFAVYDSFVTNGSNLGWFQVGGTSAGAPQWAALLAITDQGRALSGLSALDSTSPTEVMTTLYKNATTGIFHDVTTGSSSGSPAYSSATGYDYVTGLGSPKADLVVQALVGTPATPVDHLAVSAPTSATAGASFTFTVTAQTSTGVTDPNYVGTVHFTSTDAQAGLPANYTFVAADHGIHSFAVTLKTAATQAVTATDTTTAATTGTAAGIVVSPAAAASFVLSGLSSTSTVGATQTFTLTARDAYGNIATGYTGTVAFTSSDAAATLPAAYTFVAGDKGAHAFAVTFGTTGSETITATDAAGLTITSGTVTVSPAAPINLVATGDSNSTVALTWSSSAGATGYSIERSANGTTGWTQIGTTTGATTYEDSGLTAGTTYSYRVRATGTGTTSAYSNITAATTTGSTAATGGSIWSNSYTPTIDSYATGNYELGVKFKADVAGNVTGVRFFKQTWMNGYSHVGHIWTSTGTLLGTVRFTSETASGWEQANFTTPIAISANTVYVVSFSTGGGYAGISSNFFNTSGVDNGALHALANGVSGGDGVYNSGGRFPNSSGNGMNFWADVAFSPTSGGHITHFATTANTNNSNTNGSTVTIPANGSQVAPPASTTGRSVTASTSNNTPTPRVLPRQDTPVSWVYRSAVPQGVLSTGTKGFFA